MASQSWVNLLNAGPPWQTTNGNALTTSVGPLTISPQAPTTQDFVLPGQPGGSQFYAGMTLRIEASGTLLAGATTSNLTMWLSAGPNGTPHVTTAVVWNLHSKLRCLATGSTGNTLSYGGYVSFPTVALANVATLGTANQTILAIPETVTAFNTQLGTTALCWRAALSAAFGSVVCNQFTIEQLN
jgi:hypothetical protein